MSQENIAICAMYYYAACVVCLCTYTKVDTYCRSIAEYFNVGRIGEIAGIWVVICLLCCLFGI